MPDLDYVKLVGRLGLVVGDGVADPDVLPDTVWCTEGEVRITPLNVYTKVQGGEPSPWTAGHGALSASVDSNGFVSWNGQPFVWLVDLTSDKVNPYIADGQATHKVEFVNVRAAGTIVKFPTTNIRVAADSVDPETGAVDLTLAMPVPAGGGTPIIVGPPGPPGPGVNDAGISTFLADPDSESVAAASQLFVRFVDLDGQPIADRTVTIVVDTATNVVEDIIAQEAP